MKTIIIIGNNNQKQKSFSSLQISKKSKLCTQTFDIYKSEVCAIDKTIKLYN